VPAPEQSVPEVRPPLLVDPAYLHIQYRVLYLQAFGQPDGEFGESFEDVSIFAK
jgi:hypothetical protein